MRYSGIIGFGSNVKDGPGSDVWEDVITERNYQGDVVKDNRRLQPSEDGVNDNISVDNSISVVADSYAIEHFLGIKYIRWQGNLWTVTNVAVERPRLILSLGSVYNGPTG